MKLSSKSRKDVIRLFRVLADQHVEHGNFYASWWSADYGLLDVGADGYKSITTIAHRFRDVHAWRTYPVKYLQTVSAHAHLEFPNDASKATERVEADLRDNFGHQRAFVPFWGLHLADHVTLKCGSYCLTKLGDSGYAQEITEPFRQLRAGVGEEQAAEDTARVNQILAHLPNVPILPIDYNGSAKGAKEFVAQTAGAVAEMLQFLAAWLIADRSDVKIIDHRGAYFGRFSTIMPVLSRETKEMSPTGLDPQNIRGNPYGPRIEPDHILQFKEVGYLDLSSTVPGGPGKGDSITAMLLRAIQLFSDGERAVSLRQAVISYVGACDALFGKKDAADLYTCSGMAATSEGDFESAFEEAERLYDQRSEAAHRGVTPDVVEPARRSAMVAIRYVTKRKDELKNKSAVRNWIKPYTIRAEEFRKRRSAKST